MKYHVSFLIYKNIILILFFIENKNNFYFYFSDRFAKPGHLLKNMMSLGGHFLGPKKVLADILINVFVARGHVFGSFF